MDKCDVIGTCDPEVISPNRSNRKNRKLIFAKAYPIQKQALSTEYLRDHIHMRPRVDLIASMLRVRQCAVDAIHEHFRVRLNFSWDVFVALTRPQGEGFTHVHTPIITGNDCEGAGETFKLSPVAHRAGSSLPPTDFFDRTAYLTVSSQLHLEAFAHAIPRVYTLSPCFRAERSQTNRHLSEFWMLEAEWAFIDRVGDVCDIVEDAVKHILNHPGLVRDLELLWSNVDAERKQGVLQARGAAPWARMSYTEAVKELEKVKPKFEFDPAWGKPLQSEHERWLADEVAKGPVFVTDYPSSLKPFYMRTNDDGKTVACFDLLMPSLGELVGGSLREERVGLLDGAIEHHGLDRRDYSWYRDLRLYGGAPHGGFGLGFERLVGWMTGIENIRECIPFPRWADRLLL